MQFSKALLALVPVLGLVSAAPIDDAAAKKSFVVAVKGLPKAKYPNATYVVYEKNFFGDLTLQPGTDKSAAVAWTVGPNSDLVSASKDSIALTPPYSRPQAQSISYVAYNGTQGTYVKKNNHVVNRSPDFGSWRFCTSQYGAALEYETPGFNDTASNAGYPAFPCYPVKFVLEK